jgi:predicted PurR-regulated permease PerM
MPLANADAEVLEDPAIVTQKVRAPEPAPPRSRLDLSTLLRQPYDVRSFALTGLFVLAVLYTMYFVRSILLPIVLAMLLSQLLSPIVHALAKWRIPQMLGSALVLLFFCATFGFAVSLVAEPAKNWVDHAPESFHQIQEKVGPLLKRPMQKLTDAGKEMQQLTGAVSGSQKVAMVEVEHSRFPDLLFSRTPDLMASLLMLLILLYFMLGYNGVFLNKLVKVIPRLRDKKTAVTIADDIKCKISAYLVTITLVNAGVGLAVAVIAWLSGLGNPVLWGVAAALLNFVPYLGACTGMACMAVTSLLTFGSPGYALIPPGCYLLVTAIEGHFITPMLLGRSLTLNPVAILISLMFWGWMWGIVGVILAVPLLAMIKILCDHIDPLASLGEFLSD